MGVAVASQNPVRENNAGIAGQHPSPSAMDAGE
jgi:hypothetical protein